MILRFQRYTKIGIIAVISIIFLVIVGCAILIICNWFPMLAYMEGILGKRAYYNMDERGPSTYATDEAFAEAGIEIHWVNTDAMSDYFYPRYKAYNAVMSKFLTRSIGADWESKLSSRASEILRRDSVILGEINVDSLAMLIPDSRQFHRRYAEIEGKNGNVYRISLFGWRNDMRSMFLIYQINYDTATKTASLLTNQVIEIRR
ncbi:MAG: hypothetical protein IPO40_12685 [Fibrobacteres bacterium]|nr:hypothetical protein [Fibrobacterota bacterium]